MAQRMPEICRGCDHLSTTVDHKAGKHFCLACRTEYQYWSHKSSGDTFAVRLVDGQIMEIAGPLYYKDVTKANLKSYNFAGEPEDVAWAKENQENFALYTEPYEGDEAAEDVALGL